MTTLTETNLGTALDKLQQRGLIIGIVGLILCAIGVFVDREQFFRSYLYGYLYWMGMAVGSLGLLLVNHVVGGKWGVVARRLFEAGAKTLPLMAILIIPVVLGIGSLYIWSRPEIAEHDHIIKMKEAYLNKTFFIIRLVGYFAIMMLYAWILTRKSLEQDRTGAPGIIVRLRQISAPGIVVFALTGTFCFFDLVMSLEPHWFSTIYGGMFIVGQFLETFAFITAILFVLSKRPPFSQILTTQHFHDFGNFLLAFTVLWAYLSFSQFLIIWAGNLPEEIPWYIRRLHGGWGVVAAALVIFHFAVPFLILLMRFVKKNPAILRMVAWWMIVVRAVDLYWVVKPAFDQHEFGASHGFAFHWLDLTSLIGVGGIWVAAFVWNLKKHPIVPIKDSRLMGAPKQMVEGLR